MTNEIKEILDKLEIVARKHTIEVCEDGSKIETMSASVVDELRLNNYSAKILLDYITNLQEEKENAVECLKYYEEKHFIKPAVDNTKLIIELYNAYLKEINDLQQRIDKAVEYINKYEYEKYCPGPYEKNKYIMREEKEGQDLLNILRGDE